jgi:hypothetical protein
MGRFDSEYVIKSYKVKGRCGRDHMVVGFTIRAYHH